MAKTPVRTSVARQANLDLDPGPTFLTAEGNSAATRTLDPPFPSSLRAGDVRSRAQEAL